MDNNEQQQVVRRPQSSVYQRPGGGATSTTNLADLLERVLDKGIVIAGDITLSVGRVEVLTLSIRLLIASLDKAEEVGIDWWKSDPFLSSKAKALEKERTEMQRRLDRLEDILVGQAQGTKEVQGAKEAQEPAATRSGDVAEAEKQPS